MTTHDANPSKPDGEANMLAVARALSQRLPSFLVIAACVYFVISALTLPFVNSFWVGELPPLGLIQFPKSFLKSAIHTLLMAAMQALGLSRGSFSPDYIATHTLAMGLMLTIPALILIVTFRPALPRWLIALVVACAALDAVVTLWFDNVSNLSLYNASYF